MWDVVLAFGVCITLVVSMGLCLCWRKKQPKNDWLGLDGMVTQKNPDENVNHLPSAAPFTCNPSTESLDSSKRNIASNTRRSLPDIPLEHANVTWEPTGDNSSEHYATVGQYANSAKRHTIPNGLERPSISQHSSISQADEAFSPYERVKYDKIKSKEHPYAQLQPNTRQINEEILSDGPSTSEPTAPPRSRRSSAQSGVGVEIPAASAVAGGIAASSELPYMTPPVSQANFSGDSQDSSKGYTSISVREPLANIRAQTKEMNKKRRELDPHYSTVSDDSDDVYTTIPDSNNQVYTSESETYARIPAHPITVEAEVNPLPNEEEDEADRLYEPAPQPPPPSVDSLKQVTGHTYTHSRQASSSSSTANIGSPKPEKRQANSPLPPPPTAPGFDFQNAKNVDDLYAKVRKNKKDEEKSPEKIPITRNSLPVEKSERKRREHDYETLRKSPRKCSDPGYEKIKNEEPGYASINGPDSLSSSDPGYEVLKNRAPSELDPNYEELKHRTSNASDCAGYSTIKEKGYSVVNKRKKESDYPGYDTVRNEEYDSNDPNYESVKDIEEPPYERLDDESSRTDSGYEKVKKRERFDNDTSESSNSLGKSISDRSEPPYEHLGNDTDSDLPGYERIRNKNSSTDSSTSEPNYNSIKKDNKIENIKNNNIETNPSTKSEMAKGNGLMEDGIYQV